MIGYIEKAVDYFQGQKPKVAQPVPASLFYREEGMGLFSLDKGGKVLKHLPFNLLIDEDHTLNFRVSDHPLQNGSTISDHVHKEPAEVTINCLFTNHPIKKMSEVSEVTFKDDYATSEVKSTLTNKALENFDKVVALAKKREPVRLVTALQVYPKMIITSIKAPRDSKTGSAVKFTMTLREINIVQLKSVSLDYNFQPEDMLTANDRMIAAQKNSGKRTAEEMRADEMYRAMNFESASATGG